MVRTPNYTSEGRLMAEMAEVLGSSLDIDTVLERAYPLLHRLVPADYCAIGVSSTGRAEDYRWSICQLPATFFADYARLTEHDFVRQSVVAQPNRALRDAEMIGRSELEANALYRHAREVGAPIEQVMAVMLHVDQRWQSGLSLYRDRRRPFSTRECAALQRLTPLIANAVRNCHTFALAADFRAAFESVLADRGSAALLVGADGRELGRSAEATAILGRWFPAHECRGANLAQLIEPLLPPRHPLGANNRIAWRMRDEDTLEVTRFALPERGGGRAYLLLLAEQRACPSLPHEWVSRLTRREVEVLSGLLRGWDNRLIAGVVGCSEGTAKKHVQHIFDKLGVDSRATLMASALARSPH